MARKEVTKEEIAYRYKYSQESYDKISLYLPKGGREKLKTYASKLGVSANIFINNAIKEKMDRIDEAERSRPK